MTSVSAKARISRPPRFGGRHLLGLVNALICMFILAPIVVVVIISFSNDAFMQFPPSGYSFRWYESFFSNRRLIEGLVLSLQLAVVAALLSTALGLASAYALSRFNIRLAGPISGLHMAPLITPGVVTGLAILIYFGALGIRGSFWTLLAAHVILAIPFVLMIISAAMASFDKAPEEAAISLGATPLVAFFTVTAPILKTSILSAGVFAFLFSFDEVVVTLFLPGPRVKTLPVQMFEYVQFNLDPLPAAASTILIAAAMLIMVLMSRFGDITKSFALKR